MRRYASLFAVLLGALWTVSAHAAEATAPWTDVGKDIVVVGSLGRALGTIVTVQGEVLPDDARRRKGDLGKTLLRVDSLDGVGLPVPVVVELRGGAVGPGPKLQPGERFALVGYESGGFVGVPAEAFTHGPVATTTEFHFAVWFVAVKDLPVEPSATAPAANPPPAAPRR